MTAYEGLLRDAAQVIRHYTSTGLNSHETGSAASFAMKELGIDVLRRIDQLMGTGTPDD